MTIEKAIEVLKDLSSYVDEEWDREKYLNDIEEAVTALDIAIENLTASSTVGTLTLNDKTYLICESK